MDAMFLENNYCSSNRSSLMEADNVPVDDPNVNAECMNTPNHVISVGTGILEMKNDCSVMDSVYDQIEESSFVHDVKTDRSSIMNVSNTERINLSPQYRIPAPVQVTSFELSDCQQAQDRPTAHPSSDTKNLSFSISSHVSIINCTDHNGQYFVNVPRPWVASELSADGGGTIMFSLIVQKEENCVKRKLKFT